MSRPYLTLFLPLLTMLLTPSLTRAELRLPAVFADHMVLQRDLPIPVWGWASPGESVTLTLAGKSVATAADAQGKWLARLPALPAGGPFDLEVRGSSTLTFKDILIGEVWICCGQSNLTFTVSQNVNAAAVAAQADFPSIRMMVANTDVASQPLDDLVAPTKWFTCSPQTVGGFSGVGYFFGRDLHKSLNVPVGLIQTGISDTRVEYYMSKETLASDPDFAAVYTRWERWKKDLNVDVDFPNIEANLHEAYLDQRPLRQRWQKAADEAKAAGQPAPPEPKYLPWRIVKNFPTGQYCAMVHPLIPYGIRGVMWYQGEGNGTTAHEYRKLFPAMIKSWRSQWNQGDFPFLFVQLPRIYPARTEWPELRDAQLHTLRTVPNTGMAITYDLTTTGDIVHPPVKEPVGQRLAQIALAQVYKQNVPYTGPLCKNATRENAGFRIQFENTGGALQFPGDELRGFTIAEADGYFHPAQATIDKDSVLVTSRKVPAPLYVRYAWRNNPDGNLFGAAGLPASPFRTDDFPPITSRDITDYSRNAAQLDWIIDTYLARGQLDDAIDFILDWPGDRVRQTQYALRISAALLKADRPADAQRLTAELYYAAGKIEDAAVRTKVNALLKGDTP